jgi:hypothetical protein
MTDVEWRNDADLEADDRALSQMKAESDFQLEVTGSLHRMRVREAALQRLAAEKAGEQPPFDAGTLGEILTREPAPPPRVEDLIPAEAGTLVVAQRKTGKTTFELNLARSLIDGSDFLGRFGVRKLDGNVALFNFEVSGHTIATWANEHGIDRQRMFLVNLRGRRNPFIDPGDRVKLAGLLRLHDVETLIVDPFGRAFTGTNQNDPGEVGAFLSSLDEFTRGHQGAGCVDVVLAAHAGWNGERSRGSTALEDWADSIVTLTRDKDDEQQRFMRAEGRDVLIEEDQLDFEARTRTLTLSGTGSRKVLAKTRQLEAQLPLVLELLRDNPPHMSGNQLDIAISNSDLPHSKGDGIRAAQILERRGLVASKQGPRRARLFTLITSPTSLDLPQGESATSPTSLIEGEVAREVTDTHHPQGTHQERT